MVTSLTNVAGGVARILLAATAVVFNGPRFLGPDIWAHPATTEQTHARPDDERARTGFHAEVTVSRGKRQVTVQLEFGGARERSEDESL